MSGSENSLDTLYVDLKLRTTGFESAATSALRALTQSSKAAADTAGQETGKAFLRGFDSGLSNTSGALRGFYKGINTAAKGASNSAGSDAGRDFVRGFETGLGSATGIVRKFFFSINNVHASDAGLAAAKAFSGSFIGGMSSAGVQTAVRTVFSQAVARETSASAATAGSEAAKSLNTSFATQLRSGQSAASLISSFTNGLTNPVVKSSMEAGKAGSAALNSSFATGISGGSLQAVRTLFAGQTQTQLVQAATGLGTQASTAFNSQFTASLATSGAILRMFDGSTIKSNASAAGVVAGNSYGAGLTNSLRAVNPQLFDSATTARVTRQAASAGTAAANALGTQFLQGVNPFAARAGSVISGALGNAGGANSGNQQGQNWGRQFLAGISNSLNSARTNFNIASAFNSQQAGASAGASTAASFSASLNAGLTSVGNVFAKSMSGVTKVASTVGNSIGNTLSGAVNAGLRDLSIANIEKAAGAVHGLATEFAQSQASQAIWAKTIKDNNIDAKEAAKVVADLSDALKTSDVTIQNNAANLLRQGYTLKMVEEAYTTAGASGVRVGQTTAQSIEKVSTALLTGQSRYLNTIGIQLNLVDANKIYAAQLGRTVASLTPFEKKLAEVNLILKDSGGDVDILQFAFKGLLGVNADNALAMEKLRRAVGELLIPAVTKAANGVAGLIGRLQDWSKNSQQAAVLSAMLSKAYDSIGLAIVELRADLDALAKSQFAKDAMEIAGKAATMFANNLNDIAKIIRSEWPGISKQMTDLGAAIKTSWDQVSPLIIGIVNSVKTAAPIIIGVFNGIVSALKNVVKGFGEAADGITKFLTADFQGSADSFKNAMNTLGHDVSKDFNDAIQKGLSGTIDNIKTLYATGGTDWGHAAGDGFIAGFKSQQDAMGKAVSETVKKASAEMAAKNVQAGGLGTLTDPLGIRKTPVEFQIGAMSKTPQGAGGQILAGQQVVNKNIADEAITGLTAQGFTAISGWCSRWVRQVLLKAVGQESQKLFGETAIETEDKFKAAGYSQKATKENIANLQPGDVVFYRGDKSGAGHVGIYVGNGNVAGNNQIDGDKGDARGIQNIYTLGKPTSVARYGGFGDAQLGITATGGVDTGGSVARTTAANEARKAQEKKQQNRKDPIFEELVTELVRLKTEIDNAQKNADKNPTSKAALVRLRDAKAAENKYKDLSANFKDKGLYSDANDSADKIVATQQKLKGLDTERVTKALPAAIALLTQMKALQNENGVVAEKDVKAYTALENKLKNFKGVSDENSYAVERAQSIVDANKKSAFFSKQQADEALRLKTNLEAARQNIATDPKSYQVANDAYSKFGDKGKAQKAAQEWADEVFKIQPGNSFESYLKGAEPLVQRLFAAQKMAFGPERTKAIDEATKAIDKFKLSGTNAALAVEGITDKYKRMGDAQDYTSKRARELSLPKKLDAQLGSERAAAFKKGDLSLVGEYDNEIQARTQKRLAKLKKGGDAVLDQLGKNADLERDKNVAFIERNSRAEENARLRATEKALADQSDAQLILKRNDAFVNGDDARLNLFQGEINRREDDKRAFAKQLKEENKQGVRTAQDVATEQDIGDAEEEKRQSFYEAVGASKDDVTQFITKLAETPEALSDAWPEIDRLNQSLEELDRTAGTLEDLDPDIKKSLDDQREQLLGGVKGARERLDASSLDDSSEVLGNKQTEISDGFEALSLDVDTLIVQLENIPSSLGKSVPLLKQLKEDLANTRAEALLFEMPQEFIDGIDAASKKLDTTAESAAKVNTESANLGDEGRLKNLGDQRDEGMVEKGRAARADFEALQAKYRQNPLLILYKDDDLKKLEDTLEYLGSNTASSGIADGIKQDLAELKTEVKAEADKAQNTEKDQAIGYAQSEARETARTLYEGVQDALAQFRNNGDVDSFLEQVSSLKIGLDAEAITPVDDQATQLNQASQDAIDKGMEGIKEQNRQRLAAIELEKSANERLYASKQTSEDDYYAKRRQLSREQLALEQTDGINGEKVKLAKNLQTMDEYYANVEAIKAKYDEGIAKTQDEFSGLAAAKDARARVRELGAAVDDLEASVGRVDFYDKFNKVLSLKERFDKGGYVKFLDPDTNEILGKVISRFGDADKAHDDFLANVGNDPSTEGTDAVSAGFSQEVADITSELQAMQEQADRGIFPEDSESKLIAIKDRLKEIGDFPGIEDLIDPQSLRDAGAGVDTLETSLGLLQTQADELANQNSLDQYARETGETLKDVEQQVTALSDDFIINGGDVDVFVNRLEQLQNVLIGLSQLEGLSPEMSANVNKALNSVNSLIDANGDAARTFTVMKDTVGKLGSEIQQFAADSVKGLIPKDQFLSQLADFRERVARLQKSPQNVGSVQTALKLDSRILGTADGSPDGGEEQGTLQKALINGDLRKGIEAVMIAFGALRDSYNTGKISAEDYADALKTLGEALKKVEDDPTSDAVTKRNAGNAGDAVTSAQKQADKRIKEAKKQADEEEKQAKEEEKAHQKHLDEVDKFFTELGKTFLKGSTQASQIAGTAMNTIGAVFANTGWEAFGKAGSAIIQGLGGIFSSSANGVVDGFSNLSKTTQKAIKEYNQASDQTLASLTKGIATAFELLARGDYMGAAVAAITSTVATIVDVISGGAESLRKANETIDGFMDDHKKSFVDFAAWTKITYSYTGSWTDLFGPKAFASIDEFGVSLGEGIANGVQGGFEKGIKGFLDGDVNWQDDIKDAIRETIITAFIQAFIQSALLQGILKKPLSDLTEAIASGNPDNIDKAMAALGPALGQSMDLLEKTLPQFKDIFDKYLPSSESKKAAQPGSLAYENDQLTKLQEKYDKAKTPEERSTIQAEIDKQQGVVDKIKKENPDHDKPPEPGASGAKPGSVAYENEVLSLYQWQYEHATDASEKAKWADKISKQKAKLKTIDPVGNQKEYNYGDVVTKLGPDGKPTTVDANGKPLSIANGGIYFNDPIASQQATGVNLPSLPAADSQTTFSASTASFATSVGSFQDSVKVIYNAALLLKPSTSSANQTDWTMVAKR